MTEGILVIDKPRGITSHDVVDIARRRLKTKKVGHSGTLDPLATGVLLILVGRATRLFQTFMNFNKVYEATLRLGEATDSGDSDGHITQRFDYQGISRQQVEAALSKFTGKISQVPPMVSAVKYKGRPLYKFARRGIDVPRQAREITVYRLELLRFSLPDIVFRLECSRGTYVRTLGEDIARSLSCGGHISAIRRTNVGPFSIEESINLDEIDAGHLRVWKKD
ncbi:MAG: tRNA pseudouridine(55) synthase TruB [Candidatus Omnitrophota bacterium]